MIINSSNVSMNSSRKSSSVRKVEIEEKRHQKGSKISTTNYSKDVLTISDEAKEYFAKDRYKFNFGDEDRETENSQIVSIDNDKEKNDSKKSKNNTIDASSLGINSSSKSSLSSTVEIEDQATLKLKALLRILEALTGNKKSIKKLEDSLSKKISDFSDSFNTINLQGVQSNSQNSGGLKNVWTVERRESYFIKEEEVTAFSSTGFVKTADGRSISFNVNVEMSRSFEQYMENYTSEEVILKDPLVINLDSAPANISDQTFLFDIDADGKKEEISQLGRGSGFLALDKNGDGIINDGSELFGALSGNGFAELAQYDEDGNGWIDEADSIFNKLKVWTKDEKGNDVLLSLKDADLGAIYLKSASTEFSINDSETNERNAQVRSTSVYLKESGGSGSIQQIDLAVKR